LQFGRNAEQKIAVRKKGSAEEVQFGRKAAQKKGSEGE